MTEFNFIDANQQNWVDENPHQAFESVLAITKQAEHKLQENQYEQAIPLLGEAYETAAIIFDNRLESPQLTTSLTSSAIMLAHAYSVTGQGEAAQKLLHKLKRKMHSAIECANGYATKVAFFRHCSHAISEAKQDISSALCGDKRETNYH
jgi:hypothetical protein